MKKMSVLFIAAAMAAAMLAACGETKNDTVAESAESGESAVTETSSADSASEVKTGTEAVEKPAEKQGTTTTTDKTKNTAEKAAASEEASAQSVQINPFTGIYSETDLAGKRPYVFMCNNISVAVPHTGVSKSDMIMEMMEEGGITRMMVFYADPSDVPAIGSIRSARAYNIETALGYDAFLVHCGGSSEADEMVASLGVQDLDQITGRFGEDTFYRDPVRMSTMGSEHSLMAVGSGCTASAAALGYRLEHEADFDQTLGFIFSAQPADQCNMDAKTVTVTYNGGKTSTFVYNETAGTYTMYQYGEEYTDDGVSGSVPFNNVICIYANTYLQSDGQHLTIDLTSGDGYYFVGGRAAAIKWYKNGTDDVFHYTLLDGTPLQFSTGRTFVAVNQCGSYQGSCTFD